ncbi:MAG: phosphotransferase [Planctomycetes bacterium]|nr:phosphotransferase [Planctomycetota bacterium]
MPAFIPDAVLARYSPALAGLRWASVSGGFSGADVWRGDDPAAVPVFAMKAWPAKVTRTQLKTIHVWMGQVAHLAFVPTVLRTADGDDLVSHSERIWDVTRWMPGVPVANPSVAELEMAFVAVASLHRAWPVERIDVCPGVLNRLGLVNDFRTRLAGESNPRSLGSEPLDLLVRRAWSVIASRVEWAEQLLQPWKTVSFPLQPCIRDLRADHVLFSQGKIGGIVDYGAMLIDHPAVDLARLLGDLGITTEVPVSAALRAYRNVTSLHVPNNFVRILEQTGAVCSAVNWLIRLLVERQIHADERAVLSRLSGLVDRIERFAPK